MTDAVPVEIFATGTWGGRTWTESDLDAMAANFTRLREHIKPPLKLGHSDKQVLAQKDGQPALGWVDRLERTGSKLVAHVRDIPATLRELIAKRRYARVSSEIYPAWHATSWESNLKSGVQGPVLSAVALLGAEPPEVKTLEDLGKFLATEDGISFAEATPDEESITVDGPLTFDAEGLAAHYGKEEHPFTACMLDPKMMKQYPDEESRRQVCGAMKAAMKTHHESPSPLHPRTDKGAASDRKESDMEPTDKQALLDEAKVAMRAEWEAEIKAREAKVADLEARVTKLSEAEAAKDAELKRLAAENQASAEREAAAAAKALRMEAERFAENMATGDKPRLATPAQRTLAAALYERLNASDVAVKADETEPLKLTEKRDHTVRDLFVAFIEAMPSLDILLKTHSQATAKPSDNDTAMLLSEIAAKHNLKLTDPDQREQAIRLLNAQHKAPDYRVLQ